MFRAQIHVRLPATARGTTAAVFWPGRTGNRLDEDGRLRATITFAQDSSGPMMHACIAMMILCAICHS